MTTTPSIWPGPECLRSRAQRLEKLAAEHGPFGALTRIGFLERVERAEFDRRSLGIARCHAKARARMSAYIEWLRESGNGSGFAARDRAWIETVMVVNVRTSESPEAAVRAAAAREDGWPFFVMGKEWPKAWAKAFGRHGRVADLGEALLRSSAWASLPWQQDPSEVSRG